MTKVAFLNTSYSGDEETGDDRVGWTADVQSPTILGSPEDDIISCIFQSQARDGDELVAQLNEFLRQLR